jgi:hypothetical protein
VDSSLNQSLLKKSLDFLHSEIKNPYFIQYVPFGKLLTKKQLKKDALFLSKILLIGFLYSSLIVGYYLLDRFFNIHNKTKFAFRFEFLNAVFSFPGTTGSIVTSLFFSLSFTACSIIAFKVYYYRVNSEKKLPKVSKSRVVKQLLKIAGVWITVEAVKTAIREIKNMFNNALTSSGISFLGLSLLYILSFLCYFLSRIVSESKLGTYSFFKDSNKEKSTGIEKDNGPGFFQRLKKEFLLKNFSITFISCTLAFLSAFFLQKFAGSALDFSLNLPFKIDGNLITLLSNKDNFFLILFLELFIVFFTREIKAFLDPDNKTKHNNIGELIKGLFSSIQHSVLISVPMMAGMIMRNTVQNFVNKDSTLSWIVVFSIVFISGVFSLWYGCYQYSWFLNETNEDKTKINEGKIKLPSSIDESGKFNEDWLKEWDGELKEKTQNPKFAFLGFVEKEALKSAA